MSEHLQSTLGVEGYVDAQTCLEILFPNGGISSRFFRKLQAQGYIPHLKLGRRTLFVPSEVKAALEKRLKRRAMGMSGIADPTTEAQRVENRSVQQSGVNRAPQLSK
jgi:hypothetical protein